MRKKVFVYGAFIAAALIGGCALEPADDIVEGNTCKNAIKIITTVDYDDVAKIGECSEVYCKEGAYNGGTCSEYITTNCITEEVSSNVEWEMAYALNEGKCPESYNCRQNGNGENVCIKSMCNGESIDIKTNNEHCGKCGNKCVDGSVCIDGSCKTTCMVGTVLCGGKCVNPLTDNAYCGASGDCTGDNAGESCASGMVCSGGTCSVTCVSGQTVCNGKCVDTQTDNANCGGCGKKCDSGNVCSGGECRIPVGTSCTAQDKDACSGNTFVHCNIDLSVGSDDNEGVLEVVMCGESEACVISDSANGCLQKCEKTACDLDSDTGDGGFTRVVSYKCESVNDKLVFMPGESKDCGNALCDTFTNTCTGEAGIGAQCQYDNHCASRYCEMAKDATEGVCTKKKANGSVCAGDSACASGYCKESTGKCTAKAENGADCDVKDDCKSDFCSKGTGAEKGKCADAPSGFLKNGENCTDSAKCLSAYCDGTVCADKPAAPSVECGLAAKCAEGKICSKDFKCIDKPADKVGFNDACNADADCADGLKCSKQKKCRIAADVKVGASYKECVGSEYDNLVTYTCTEVDGVKVFVPAVQSCGCRAIPENNSAQCE